MSSFAIVLMTPDDSGSALASESTRLPRTPETPSDEVGHFRREAWTRESTCTQEGRYRNPFKICLAGVLYTELDEHGGWKRKLLSELAYAGVPFDKDKALSA